MGEFLILVRAIPDVVWSGIIAAVIALSGVLISNASNTRRLRIQLEHDASEKGRERHNALRREVYLKAVEELTKVNGHLASLPQKDPSKENLGDGVQAFAAAAAKLQLVAEPQTALLANELAGDYGVLTLKLLGKAIPLHRTRIDIGIEDNLYNQAQAQVQRVLAEITKFNESGEADPRKWDPLQRSFDAFMEQATTHADRRSAAWTAFNRLNLEFSAELVSELRVLGKKQIPLLVEIRRDLGLTTDLDAFQAQMERQWLVMSAELASLLGRVEGELHGDG